MFNLLIRTENKTTANNLIRVETSDLNYFQDSSTTQKSHRDSVGVYQELTTAETVESLIDDMTEVHELYFFFSILILPVYASSSKGLL